MSEMSHVLRQRELSTTFQCIFNTYHHKVDLELEILYESQLAHIPCISIICLRGLNDSGT